MADIVVSVGSSPVINTMNGDEYQIYKILENIEEQLSTKVDKVVGKGLSTNDYTTEEKTKLSELPTKTELDTNLSGKEVLANKTTTLDENSADTQYPSAKATYDELVKKADKQNSNGGFEGGLNSESSGGGGAVGKNACADSGGAVGFGSSAGRGGAVGDGAQAGIGFSGGLGAKTVAADGSYVDAIQLGTGTNPNEKTLQIYNYQLVDANGHIPNDRIPTAGKAKISHIAGNSPQITLTDNTEFICGEIKNLNISVPSELPTDNMICSILFESGNTATVISNPNFQYFEGYYQGTDCKNGVFLPKANKRYTLIITYTRGYRQYGVIDCYIAAVPIQTTETQSADDFPAANDESVAEPTESEPNEVI